jgi:DNA-binding SARP family transcriptional activator
MSVLGEIKVARGGKAVALPASRKARALLIYFAVTGRPHRRDRLCAMFWDTPDDPRGALRSSLSKLRTVVDGPDRRRIVATRDSVRFDTTDMDIDLLTIRRRLAGDLHALPTQSLEHAAAAFHGDFADGLDLAKCPDFEAWRVADARTRGAYGHGCCQRSSNVTRRSRKPRWLMRERSQKSIRTFQQFTPPSSAC